MENEHSNVIESLFDRTTDYFETRAELLKLKASKKSSAIISNLVSKIVLGAVFGMFLMLVNIALGLWLGSLLNASYLGFFVLAGFYLIVGVIIYSSRKKIIEIPIANSIIDKINN